MPPQTQITKLKVLLSINGHRKPIIPIHNMALTRRTITKVSKAKDLVSVSLLKEWVLALVEHIEANQDLFCSGGVLRLVPTEPMPSLAHNTSRYSEVRALLDSAPMREVVVEQWKIFGMTCKIAKERHGNAPFAQLCKDHDHRLDLCCALPCHVASADPYTSLGKRQGLLTMIVCAEGGD